MDLNKEISLNSIPLIVRFKKLKRPIISLLNEYEKNENVNYDVFEKVGNGICAMVDIPEDLADLHGCLEDMIRVTQIASLKYEIGRDALRLAVHLFYRVILKEKLYEYYDFILFYEQYNKSWKVFSEDYHNTYTEWQSSLSLEEKDELGPQQERPSRIQGNGKSEDLSFEDLCISDNIVRKKERIIIDQDKPIQAIAELEKDNVESAILPLARMQIENGQHRTDVILTAEKEKFVDEDVLFEPRNCVKNQRCFYIDEDGSLKECIHSQFVLYQLHRSGDFVMVPGDSGDHHRECPCYTMKCTVIREIHPCYRDIAWGKKWLCMFRYWCFVNCFISTESLQMLKAMHPWIAHLREGILVPCVLNDFKRLTLRTTALKSLIYNYLNVYTVERSRCLRKSL